MLLGILQTNATTVAATELNALAGGAVTVKASAVGLTASSVSFTLLPDDSGELRL